MFKNRFHRAFFAENDDWNGGWGTAPEKTPDSEAGKEEKKEENNIPYERFKEVNDRMKSAEAELQKYKEAEQKKAEEEAIAKGEQEKVIAQKNEEIEALKKEQETWKARETAVAERNNQRIASLEKQFGERWNDVKTLVEDIKDPFVLSGKLDSLEKMSTTTVKAPDWWSKIPWGSWNTRKQELMDKLKKEWRLTAKEKNELYELVDKK